MQNASSYSWNRDENAPTEPTLAQVQAIESFPKVRELTTTLEEVRIIYIFESAQTLTKPQIQKARNEDSQNQELCDQYRDIRRQKIQLVAREKSAFLRQTRAEYFARGSALAALSGQVRSLF